ncbi:Hypothetical protein LUCI_1067 [Lucifera butyrica]|uniref:Uncharacterized protein n=1 Tax=Lucifera butyrica TaxID=1351585 RepID=A0A498R028_9FIRM|nr:hypothetical protein [Lucifera butyrica]VBB05856.1 Hypothetical protein LUCI_1067 [Lucifera butyrica]
MRRRDISFCLTSIGYDGEGLDNITGLPKPKLRAETGDIVVTAEKCLTAGTAKLDILQKTGLTTPLGDVVVTRVKKPGLVVTAGPNKSSQVRSLTEILRRIGPGAILFDGALNRIAPMVETDGFVLATGAARTPDISRLARETEWIWGICNILVVPRAAELARRNLDRVTLLTPELEKIQDWPLSSLLSVRDTAGLFLKSAPEDSYLYIPGIVSMAALRLMSEIFRRNARRVVLAFADPVKLLVSGEIGLLNQLLEDLDRAGALVGVLKRVPLMAVTINPFYPEYRTESMSYQPATVDFIRLQVAIQKNIRVPVYNVCRQGAKELVDSILTYARPWESPDVMCF